MGKYRWKYNEKHINPKDKKILAISLIMVLIGSGISIFYFWFTQKPDLSIENVNYDGNTINFRVSNSGQATASSTKFWYANINQTKNTCGNNIIFFNYNWTPMCSLIVRELGENGYCQIDVPTMATGNYYSVKYQLNSEWTNFRLNYPNATNCEITETIVLYAADKSVNTKSMPIDVELKT